MEEVEGLTENSEETIHEHAHGGPKWTSWVALSTALLAALAAVCALLSGSNESEAMLHQLQASDQWNYYQAKGVKSKTDQGTVIVLAALGKTPDAALTDGLGRYKEEQDQIKEKASDLEKERDIELKRHETFSKGVTLLQVSISISAISILTKRRRYWGVSLVFGAGGLFFLIFGLLQYLKH